MISITCTHCKTLLEMDDAFAGGVCRCQHCGTIQTVPSQLKRPASPQVTASADGISGSRAVFGRSGSESAVSSELEGLAEIVASSGLRSRHSSPRPNQPTLAGSRRSGRKNR